MATRFSLDQPMDVDKFIEISLRACDEYKKWQERLIVLESDTRYVIQYESSRVREIISAKAEKTSRIVQIITYILCALMFVSVICYAVLKADIDKSDLTLIQTIFALIITLIILTIIMAVPPIIWLVALYNSDSTGAKIVWGLILGFSGIFSLGTLIALIAFIICMINSEDDWLRRYRKKHKYKRMLIMAESKDNAATEKYQSEAMAIYRQARNEVGEYDWLYFEWADKAESLIADINDTQRRHTCVKYWNFEKYADCVRYIVEHGPSTVNFNQYETPYHYMEITVESVQDSFDKFVCNALDRELQEALQGI